MKATITGREFLFGIIGLLVVGVAAFLAILVVSPAFKVSASVSQGSEYQGTTTSQGRFLADAVLPANSSLGSVIITGPAAGVINLYDATTANPSLRAASMGSSTILLASFPLNAATGTYTFDRVIFNGLLVNIVGTVPTTTITFR